MCCSVSTYVSIYVFSCASLCLRARTWVSVLTRVCSCEHPRGSVLLPAPVSVFTCSCESVCARLSVCLCVVSVRTRVCTCVCLSLPTAHTGLLSCSPGPTTLQSAAARLRVIGEVCVTKPDAWLILHFSRVCRLRSWPLRPSHFKERDSPCPSAAGMGQRGTGMMVSRGLTS